MPRGRFGSYSIAATSAGNAGLVALEVDDPVEPLVAAAAVTRRDATAIVAAGMLLQRLDEALLGFFLRDLLEGADAHRAPPRRGWFVLTNWHLHFLPSFGAARLDLLEDVDALAREQSHDRLLPARS